MLCLPLLLIYYVMLCLPLTSAQLCQSLLPDFSKADLDLEAVQTGSSLWWREFSRGSREQSGEYGGEIFVNLFVSLLYGNVLLLIQLGDYNGC